MQDQYKHPQSVRVSADFYGEYQKLANDKYVFEIQPTVSASLIIFQSATIVVYS